MTATVRFRQRPTTSIVRVQPKGKPVVSARSFTAQRRHHMTAEEAKDPEQVARAINSAQDEIAKSTQSARNDPETGAIVFVGVSIVGGVTKVFTHNFGRPFQGYRVTRTYASASAPISFRDGALPTGVSFLTSVALIPNGTGTVDVRIW